MWGKLYGVNIRSQILTPRSFKSRTKTTREPPTAHALACTIHRGHAAITPPLSGRH